MYASEVSLGIKSRGLRIRVQGRMLQRPSPLGASRPCTTACVRVVAYCHEREYSSAVLAVQGHDALICMGRWLQLGACVQASASRISVRHVEYVHDCKHWYPRAPGPYSTADTTLHSPSPSNLPAYHTHLLAKPHTCRRREKRNSACRATASTQPSSAHAHGLLRSSLLSAPSLLLPLLPTAVQATVATPLKGSMWCSQVERKGRRSTRMSPLVAVAGLVSRVEHRPAMRPWSSAGRGTAASGAKGVGGRSGTVLARVCGGSCRWRCVA